MDIVSRLKKFINHIGIPVTQFADNCNIPRPTLSQLLNGRNKKVSDEFIGKIHEVYPDLSVLWLMFGEGSMLHNSNIKISEPQNSEIFEVDVLQDTDSKQDTAKIEFHDNFQKIPQKNSFEPQTSQKEPAQPNLFQSKPKPEYSEVHANYAPKPYPTSAHGVDSVNKNKFGAEENIACPDSGENTSIVFNTNQTKKIVNIIVYYDDNSFESFIPK